MMFYIWLEVCEMFKWLMKYSGAMTVAVLSAVCACVPAFAASLPATGDGSGMLVPVMGGLLGLSVILIIIFLVVSSKKKRP